MTFIEAKTAHDCENTVYVCEHGDNMKKSFNYTQLLRHIQHGWYLIIIH